jgi:mycothiol synthase
MRLRPATPEDARAAAALVVAVDIDQVGEADYSLEALHDEWHEVGFELARDAVVAEDDAGTPVGYAHFRGSDLLAVVDPRREGEGTGTALLEWAERRGRERGLKTLRQAVGDRGARARALLESAGWTPVRSFWRMERDVGADDAEPAGLRAVTAEDAPALHVLHEAAFSRVGGYTPVAEEVWTQREFGAHGFDLELGRVAERDGRPVGFALARRWEDDVVYVPLLAVHPEAAGRGLGGALLRGVFAAAAAAGLRQVQLNVAADNPGAVRLYERVGMSQRWRVDDYQKPLPD